MLKSNNIFQFGLKLMVIYFCFLILNHCFNLEQKYAEHFRSINTYWFQPFCQKGYVNFQASKEVKNDTYIYITSYELINKAHMAKKIDVRQGVIKVNSKVMGFLPLILFLTLLLASPISILRKLIAGFIGLLFLYIFMWFCVWILLMSSFEKFDWLQVVEIPYFFSLLIDFFCSKILGYTATILIFPVFIWILVTFSTSDWKTSIKQA